jgi:hypothetical protein
VQVPSETPPSDTCQIAELIGDMLRRVDGADVSFHSAPTGAVTTTFACDGIAYCCAFIAEDELIAGHPDGYVRFLCLEELNATH